MNDKDVLNTLQNDKKYSSWYKQITKGMNKGQIQRFNKTLTSVRKDGYDYRSAIKDGVVPMQDKDGRFKWPGKYKQENHPTKKAESRVGKTLSGGRLHSAGTKSQRGFKGRQEGTDKKGRKVAVTEYSTGLQLKELNNIKKNLIEGKDPNQIIQMPTLVPTLTKQETQRVVNSATNEKGFDPSNPMDRSIMRKSKRFAEMRINQMKSPFMESYDIPMGQYADGGYINKMHPKLQGVTKPSKIRKA